MARRRRNPIRTTGALIINPRRRKRTARKRKRTTKRRRNSLRVRTNSLRIRTNRRRNAKRRAPRRRNALRVRTNARRRNARRRAPRLAWKNTRRRNTARRRNPVRRRNMRRRRNPDFAAKLKKFPIIGGLLASMASVLPFAAFGAIGVIPTQFVAGLVARYAPMVPASWVYLLSGALAAALIDNLPVGSKELRQKLAIATMSAAGGVAYYKMSTGQDMDVGDEMAGIAAFGSPFGRLLGMSQSFGNPGPTAVYPLGYAGQVPSHIGM